MAYYIEQAGGAGTGGDDESLEDCWIGLPVTINVPAEAGSTYLHVLLDRAGTETATLADETTATATITPTVTGTLRVRSTAYRADGTTEVWTRVIRTTQNAVGADADNGICPTAFGELPSESNAGGNARGYIARHEKNWRAAAAVAGSATKPAHVAIVTPATAKSTTGKEPTAKDYGALLVQEFTLDNDAAWRIFKIPTQYISDAAVHVHWTKSGDTDESTKGVRWRVTYKAFPGEASGDVTASQTTIDIDDTYDDAGTTTRVVHRTADTPLTGVAAGWYLAVKVEATTPAGAALASEPALASLDLTFTETVA